MPQQKREAEDGTEIRCNSRETVQRLSLRLQGDYGPETGRAIMKAIIEECGGLRICLPDMQDLYRQERDKYIRDKFHGDTCQYEEFALAFNLHVRQVRRIIHGERKEIDPTQ